MFGIISTFLRPTLQAVKTTFVHCDKMHVLTAVTNSQAGSHIVKVDPTSIYSQVRNKVRCYFPRPNEVMRIRKHGWEKRLSTKSGRRVIMRRILKGRHVLSH